VEPIQRKTMTTECDCCGVRVSTKGFLGGGIVCHTCSRYKRTGDTEKLQARIDKYGGGENYTGDIQELLY